MQAEQFSLPHDDPEFFLIGLSVLYRWLGGQSELMRLAQWARLQDRLPTEGLGSELWTEVRLRACALAKAGVLRADQPRFDVLGAAASVAPSGRLDAGTFGCQFVH